MALTYPNRVNRIFYTLILIILLGGALYPNFTYAQNINPSTTTLETTSISQPVLNTITTQESNTSKIILNYLIVIFLVALSGLFSGLTLGLMTLSAAELKRKAHLGDRDALLVYRVRKDGNLLLTTLLIGNVAVNATISIFLGSISTGLIAWLLSTILIVVLGEILPQALFSRFALKFSSKLVYIVRFISFILYPISRPISLVLDKLLGKELNTVYSKKELIKIIEEHEDSTDSDIDEEEEKILKGALSFSQKTVAQVMTPKIVVKAFEVSQTMNKQLLNEIRKSGNSRFPIYDGNMENIVGMLYAKKLLGKKIEGKKVLDFMAKTVYFVDEK